MYKRQGRALFDAEACSKLDGVDLSEAMCEKARQTGLYEDVAKGELCPYRGVRISHELPMIETSSGGLTTPELCTRARDL